MFDLEKLTQSVAYLLRKYNGRLNYTKLIKLMYLADREAIKETGSSITGDDYYSMKNGPIASYLLDLIKGTGEISAQKTWNTLFAKNGYDLIELKNDIPRDWISDFDVSILDNIDNRFHGMGWHEIVEWTHNPANCPEWQRPPNNGRAPITKADIMRALGYDEEYIAAVIEDDAIYDEEEQYLRELENRLV